MPAPALRALPRGARAARRPGAARTCPAPCTQRRTRLQAAENRHCTLASRFHPASRCLPPGCYHPAAMAWV